MEKVLEKLREAGKFNINGRKNLTKKASWWAKGQRWNKDKQKFES